MWKTKIENLWIMKKGQGRIFNLLTIMITPTLISICAMNFVFSWAKMIKPKEPELPKPEPLVMGEKICLKGHLFQFSYINKGQRRISLDYLGTLQEQGKNKNPKVQKQAIFWLGQKDDEAALKFFEEILLKKKI